jgi:hypothetical protein
VSDEQDISEALDEGVVEDDEDYSGDEFGEDLPTYPPDRPYGVNTVGVTPMEEELGDSFAERSSREVPEDAPPEDRSEVGQLVEPDSSGHDDEEELIAEEAPGDGRSPEEAAMHLEPDEPHG